MSVVMNISAYRFATLSLREKLIQSCREWGLKGTILLSTEGINLFVAGPQEHVHSLLDLIRAVPGLEDIQAKESESRDQPFTRMLVKIKKEIIAFGVPDIDPVHAPAPRISPRQLKQWLDEKRPVILMDTRNNFEVNLGTFREAQAIGIDHFRDFPDAASRLTREAGSPPIVTFCTGGIRCEKAAPYLLKLGFEEVYQLDGGILKYFEECGNDHYDGECFVFDKRVGLAADLNESGHGLCYVCQSLLTPEEQADPLTVEGVSCPRCYRSPEQLQVQLLAEHRVQLRELALSMPGKQPLDNFRPLKIAQRHDGWTILDFLCDVFPQISREGWLGWLWAEDVVDAEHRPVPPAHVVHPGERYYTRERLQSEPDINPDLDLIHEDAALIVVNKPAPLPMHPSGRFHRNTLEWMLRAVYAPQKPRPSHRLDANTSGIAVFTRTSTFARQVQPQFERGEVEKHYLARVIGHPPYDEFRCDAPIATTVGHSGARIVSETDGLPAITDFRVIQRFSDGTALLHVMPRTGRTNQIRVHLWSLGWPILGDAMYRPGRQLGDVQTLTVTDPPLCLHARRLTLIHPQSQELATYEAPAPTWSQIPAVSRQG